MTRKILDFLKSPSGKFILFFLAVIIFAFVFKYYKSLPDIKKKNAEVFSDEIAIEREYSRFREQYQQLDSRKNEAVKTKEKQKLKEQEKENDDLADRLAELEKALAHEKALNALNQTKKHKPVEKEPKKKETFSLSPVNLYTAKITKKPETLKALNNYAPFGRLIKCQLINTVDSSSFETPIIALVTENVWHKGRIIIPAGTEVHGKAQSITQRNRIAAEKDWNLVWRTQTEENGFELPLSAIALDHAKDINTGRYEVSDGSAGLRGTIIETDEYSKLRLYASLFLRGAAQGVTELILEEARSNDENTLINSSQSTNQNKSSEDNQVKVGIAKGASEAIDQYARDMMDAIARDGVFVRVKAGSSFYLYVTQTIDKSQAYPGATSGAEKNPDNQTQSEEDNDLKEANRLLLEVAKKRLEKEDIKTKSEKK